MSHPRQERSPTTVVYRPMKKALSLGVIFLAFLVLLLIFGGLKDHISIDITIPGVVLTSIMVIASVAAWAQRLSITRNLDDATLCIDQRWFSFRGHNTTHPVQEIHDVALEIEREGKSCSHRLVLVLRDGTRVPIVDDFTTEGRHHERAAREIRTLLKLPNPDAAVTVLEAPQPRARP